MTPIAEAFAELVASGMDADAAFVVLTISAAKGAPSALDGACMAAIRALIKAYAAQTGQESLLWSANW